jgi:predicted enzyme related to lactoylglutathione lyase
MNRVTHFEIYTADPKALQPFYEQVFGWKFNKFEGGPIEYWSRDLEHGGGRIAGRNDQEDRAARRKNLRA